MKNKRISSVSRHRYLLERDRIKNEIGNLDQIREALGLSQRRACQLLLVDPSAWTRWNKTEAPPHIYQALKWLLELKRNNPSAVGPGDLASRIDIVQSMAQTKIKNLEDNVAMLERAMVLTPAPVSKVADEFMQKAIETREELLQKRIDSLEEKILEILARETAPKKPLRKKALRPTKKLSQASARVKRKKKGRSLGARSFKKPKSRNSSKPKILRR